MLLSGISPNDVDGFKGISDFRQIRQLAEHPKVMAIGEIGLDYYWNKENKELQKEMFVKQIEIANELDLPIIIHTRDVVEDAIDILKNKIPCKNKGVFHCCALNRELVKEALKLDYYISFAGPVTFKNSKSAGDNLSVTHCVRTAKKNADEVISMVPTERLLIETDAPYLSPEPFRGKRNDSRNLKYTAEKIAKVKEMTIEEVAEVTYANAMQLFKIK
ncbi:MAG: TatD family hydrolase [Oscillospiraceae bacterium]|nr:TatD family hydrolase [Oscillospiraceae bacterium]